MSEVTANGGTGAVASTAQDVPVNGVGAEPGAIEGSEGAIEAQKAAIQNLKRMYKLKVDGEESEVEFDPGDEQSVIRELQMSRAAKKRMAEASEIKKQLAHVKQALEGDPLQLLKRLGPQGREIAEKYLLEQIQDEMLSPQERESKQMKAELEKLKREHAEREAHEKKTLAQQTEYRYAQEVQKTILEAAKKTGLPPSPEIIKDMARLMKISLEYGIELTPDQIAHEVKKQRQVSTQALAKDATVEQLLELIGKDNLDKIRKYDIQALQQKQTEVFKNPPPPKREQASKPKGNRPISIDEWRDQVAKRIAE